MDDHLSEADLICTELARRSAAWSNIRDRAERGLEFSKAQRKLCEGFPDAEYWGGKAAAYEVILDLL